MLFSATLNEKVQQFVNNNLKEAITIRAKEEDEIKPFIEEVYYYVELEDKYDAFKNQLIIENPSSCMIFCGTKDMVNVLCRRLRKDDIKAGMIHGDLDQQDRLRTIEAFRNGAIRYLIVTDVVARGIDFDSLSHVFNYDYPTGKETYIHRIGRTGRNGQKGKAISFLTDSDTSMCLQVENYRNINIPYHEYRKATIEENKKFLEVQLLKPILKKRKGADFKKSITRLTIGGGRKSKMRTGDIVGALCNIDGIQSTDLGTIDIRESICYVEILNGKGDLVFRELQNKAIKGKIRKVKYQNLNIFITKVNINYIIMT